MPCIMHPDLLCLVGLCLAVPLLDTTTTRHVARTVFVVAVDLIFCEEHTARRAYVYPRPVIATHVVAA